MSDVILKRFETPDETRLFEKGKLELIHIGGMTIGKASYEPGWKWSEHVSPIAGTSFCEIEHVGMVLSGSAMAAMNDGTDVELTVGSLYYIPPVPHDSRVIGDETYVSLHLGMFMGTAIVSGESHALLGFDVIAVAYVRKVRLEENTLRKAFGAAYDEYRRDSWAIVPGLF